MYVNIGALSSLTWFHYLVKMNPAERFWFESIPEEWFLFKSIPEKYFFSIIMYVGHQQHVTIQEINFLAY